MPRARFVVAAALLVGACSTSAGGKDAAPNCDADMLVGLCPAGSSPEVEVRCEGAMDVARNGTTIGVCRSSDCNVFCRLEFPCLCGVRSATAERIECADCTTACGDSLCEPGEDPNSCALDCGPRCVAAAERCYGADREQCGTTGFWERVPCAEGAICAAAGDATECLACDVDAPPTWFVDRDGDTFGDPEGATFTGCRPPSRFVADNTDCDDTNFAVKGGPECDDPPITLGGSRWPDSATFSCTDGTAFVEPCPAPGNEGFGQDGSYRINVPTYPEVESGILRDSVTGLEWEASSTNDTLVWDAANARCDALQLGGRTWRLPTRLELASLLNTGGPPAFPTLQAGAHFATTSASDPGRAWLVDFSSQQVATSSKGESAFVVCATGIAPFPGALESQGEVVTDRRTGLRWQARRAPTLVTWLEALNHCEASEVAGTTDWRLSSAKELLTLVAADQRLLPQFDGADGDTYWTSSPDSVVSAKVIRMPGGEFGADILGAPNHARCVRGPG